MASPTHLDLASIREDLENARMHDHLETLEVLLAERDRYAAQARMRERLLQEAVAELQHREAALDRVRELCKQAKPGLSLGCTCYGDQCQGHCRRGTVMAWDLDPAAIEAALDARLP